MYWVYPTTKNGTNIITVHKWLEETPCLYFDFIWSADEIILATVVVPYAMGSHWMTVIMYSEQRLLKPRDWIKELCESPTRCPLFQKLKVCKQNRQMTGSAFLLKHSHLQSFPLETEVEIDKYRLKQRKTEM